MNLSEELVMAEMRTVYDKRAANMVAYPDYALHPFPEAFEQLEASILPMLIDSVRHQFDVTAYYSARKPGLSEEDDAKLWERDRAAYEAAIAAGGLIVYFRGNVLSDDVYTQNESRVGFDFKPNCMSACIWDTRRQALAGSNTDAHRQATAGLRRWFDGCGIVKMSLTTSLDRQSILFDEYERRQLF